jgi:hypothetical protein
VQLAKMEKRLNVKVENYITSFKSDVCSKINVLCFEDKSKMSELIQYIYDYERLSLQKDDFVKRRRIKNAIPNSNRCNAKRANGEQCTRRRKCDEEFCGTHSKGTPHGLINAADSNETSNITIEVSAVEVMGIVYYVDEINNVYNTEDVMNGVNNPRIIAKYVKKGSSIIIPELGLV